MGIVKKILGNKNVKPVSTLYSDYASVDLSENFHLHWRNCRFVMDDEEFRDFLGLVNDAQKGWRRLGKPNIHKNSAHGDQYILSTRTIKDHPGSTNPFIANEGIRIELIQWADFIHLHWKWVRLEFDYQEFLDFADTVAEAAEQLRKTPWFESAPRRNGTHHVACPRGRVDKPDNEHFWTQAGQDHCLDDSHRTIFLDDSDAETVKFPNAKVTPDESGRPSRRTFVGRRFWRLRRFLKALKEH